MVNVKKTHQKPFYSDVVNIILIKNPYAWLLSLHRKPHGSRLFREKYIHLTFTEFLDTKWMKYDNAIKRYNEMMLLYIDFLETHKSALLIDSLNVQKDPEFILNNISNNFDLAFKKDFENIDKEVNSGGNLVEQFTRLDYYINEDWKGKLSKENIKTINSQIDQKVFDYFGYDKL